MPETQLQAEHAYDQVIAWLEHFEPLDDPRQSGKVWYRLDEVLLLCLLAVLASAESWVEIAEFGKNKLDFLRRFRPFANGTASHDQLGDLFAALDDEAFQHCFINWVASLTKLGPDIVAIDGKTLRRAYQEGGAKAPIHMISAWSSRQRLVLGQAKVADKSNEITAIPELLDLLTLKGATVTIDAMGCQKEIAKKIKEKDADYVLALKGNQGWLSADVELFFTEQKARKFQDTIISRHQTLEKSHGRIEQGSRPPEAAPCGLWGPIPLNRPLARHSHPHKLDGLLAAFPCATPPPASGGDANLNDKSSKSAIVLTNPPSPTLLPVSRIAVSSPGLLAPLTPFAVTACLANNRARQELSR